HLLQRRVARLGGDTVHVVDDVALVLHVVVIERLRLLAGRGTRRHGGADGGARLRAETEQADERAHRRERAEGAQVARHAERRGGADVGAGRGAQAVGDRGLHERDGLGVEDGGPGEARGEVHGGAQAVGEPGGAIEATGEERGREAAERAERGRERDGRGDAERGGARGGGRDDLH